MRIDPYVNFAGNTEEAFSFYKSVFGGEFQSVMRFKDVPDLPDREKMSEADLEKIMHISLRVGDTVLMGTDVLESMGQSLTKGDNISLSLTLDTKEASDRLFALLGDGGVVELPMQEMFWGDYFGMVIDKFGIEWMLSVALTK